MRVLQDDILQIIVTSLHIRDGGLSHFLLPVRLQLQVVILGLQFSSLNFGALPRLVSLIAALCHLCDLRIDLAGGQVSLTCLGELLGVQFYKKKRFSSVDRQ